MHVHCPSRCGYGIFRAALSLLFIAGWTLLWFALSFEIKAFLAVMTIGFVGVGGLVTANVLGYLTEHGLVSILPESLQSDLFERYVWRATFQETLHVCVILPHVPPSKFKHLSSWWLSVLWALVTANMLGYDDIEYAGISNRHRLVSILPESLPLRLFWEVRIEFCCLNCGINPRIWWFLMTFDFVTRDVGWHQMCLDLSLARP